MIEGRPPAEGEGPGRLSFQTRITVAVLCAAVIPLGTFGILLILGGALEPGSGSRFLLLMVAVTVVLAVLVGFVIGADLTAPLRGIAAAVRRVGDGDLTQPIRVRGSDVLAQLAESHNRLAADVERRNRQLGRMLTAVEATSPSDGQARLVERAARDAEAAFGLISAEIRLVDPRAVPVEERIPGDPLPVRAEVRAGDETLGLLTGHLQATRSWERADQALLGLYASQVGAALRNAQLFAQVEDQNAQLRSLSEAKDDFLRGVSHNLQTPLARIKANAEGIAAAGSGSTSAAAGSAGSGAAGGPDQADPRLTIITDQADRLSRMVAQLLLVSRLESQPLRPQADVTAIGPRIRKAWDALGVPEREMTLDDSAVGWLAVADGDQLDQVLWALLDNAVRYGRGAIHVSIGVDRGERRVWTTIADSGPGLSETDRAKLFERFSRGDAGRAAGDGSGLGLYVSRALMRGMGGDLSVDDSAPGQGAVFRLTLPGEVALEP